MYGEDLSEASFRHSLEKELTFHYFKWVCGYVYHCAEAGVEVQ